MNTALRFLPCLHELFCGEQVPGASCVCVCAPQRGSGATALPTPPGGLRDPSGSQTATADTSQPLQGTYSRLQVQTAENLEQVQEESTATSWSQPKQKFIHSGRRGSLMFLLEPWYDSAQFYHLHHKHLLLFDLSNSFSPSGKIQGILTEILWVLHPSTRCPKCISVSVTSLEKG